MLEAAFERKVRALLKSLPGSYVPDKEISTSQRGIPDIVCCINSVYCALEVKKNEEQALKKTGRIVLQKYTLGDIESAGGFAAIVWPGNLELVMDELRFYCGVNCR